MSEVYNIIFPILKKRNISAIFFINPDFVDNETVLYKHKISLIICNLEEKNFPKSDLLQISNIMSFDFHGHNDFIKK
ncbi:MAG: hypothetical protein H7174_09100, partial [Flavobacterium sp.]|nr:hypothetical protein [Flavobacterium sp.]